MLHFDNKIRGTIMKLRNYKTVKFILKTQKPGYTPVPHNIMWYGSSFHRQGRRSQSLQVRSSYDLELYSTKYQATTFHWLFQTQSQNSPFFPPRLAMFPTLLYASASDSSSLEFVRYINSVIIIIIMMMMRTN